MYIARPLIHSLTHTCMRARAHTHIVCASVCVCVCPLISPSRTMLYITWLRRYVDPSEEKDVLTSAFRGSAVTVCMMSSCVRQWHVSHIARWSINHNLMSSMIVEGCTKHAVCSRSVSDFLMLVIRDSGTVPQGHWRIPYTPGVCRRHTVRGCTSSLSLLRNIFSVTMRYVISFER